MTTKTTTPSLYRRNSYITLTLCKKKQPYARSGCFNHYQTTLKIEKGSAGTRSSTSTWFLVKEKENLIRMPLRNSRGINMMIHHLGRWNPYWIMYYTVWRCVCSPGGGMYQSSSSYNHTSVVTWIYFSFVSFTFQFQQQQIQYLCDDQKEERESVR